MSYELSIIIPVFNKWELTHNCLVSLKEYTASGQYEVIVVDNASSDATATQLEPLGNSLFGSRFRAIRNQKNNNFGPACNQGAKAANAPFIFFLNNDTVMTPNWLPPLLQSMRQEPNIGAVGPLLLYPDDTVQHMGVTFFINTVKHLYQGYPRAHPVVTKKRNVQALTGAALLLSKDLFWQCGGFYEEYENGFEDIDLCLQIYGLGKKMRCISESVIYHLESQTPGRKTNDDKNAVLLSKRFGAILKPDAHIHALRDNFVPAIDDMLNLSTSLSEADNKRLNADAPTKSAEWIYKKVEENPAWLSGIKLLKNMFDANALHNAAFYYAGLESKHYRSVTNMEDLLKRATQLNNQSVVDKIQKHLDHLYHLYSGSPSPAEQTLRLHMRRALDVGDKNLAQLCEDKLNYAQAQALQLSAENKN